MRVYRKWHSQNWSLLRKRQERKKEQKKKKYLSKINKAMSTVWEKCFNRINCLSSMFWDTWTWVWTGYLYDFGCLWYMQMLDAQKLYPCQFQSHYRCFCTWKLGSIQMYWLKCIVEQVIDLNNHFRLKSLYVAWSLVWVFLPFYSFDFCLDLLFVLRI